jgi:hypothetical protein
MATRKVIKLVPDDAKAQQRREFLQEHLAAVLDRIDAGEIVGLGIMALDTDQRMNFYGFSSLTPSQQAWCAAYLSAMSVREE